MYLNRYADNELILTKGPTILLITSIDYEKNVSADQDMTEDEFIDAGYAIGSVVTNFISAFITVDQQPQLLYISVFFFWT